MAIRYTFQLLQSFLGEKRLLYVKFTVPEFIKDAYILLLDYRARLYFFCVGLGANLFAQLRERKINNLISILNKFQMNKETYLWHLPLH